MEFEISVSKWRCGENGPNKHGEGSTYLLNREGFMCCLGQVSLQLGIEASVLLDKTTPRWLKRENILCELGPFSWSNKDYRNTELADDAMKINDNLVTTVEEKKVKLTELFKEHGHELIFTE